MLKYHVAVCDDEKSDLDGIVQSVQQYDVQGCFDIETYMDGNELLSELQMQKKCFCCRKPCCGCSFELLPANRREE